jgi:hypothetical protein
MRRNDINVYLKEIFGKCLEMTEDLMLSPAFVLADMKHGTICQSRWIYDFTWMSVEVWLLETRVRIFPSPVAERSKTMVWAQSLAGFVGSNSTGGHGYLCCVLWVKAKKGKLQDKQDKETSTDEVQTEYKRIQKKTFPLRAWMSSVRFVVCCVGGRICSVLITRSESYRVCVCVCVRVCVFIGVWYTNLDNETI